MGSKHYTITEKAETLAILESNGGNISATSRDTGVSRRSIRKWESNKKRILKDAQKVQSIQKSDEGISAEDADEIVENDKMASDYQAVKKHLSSTFGNITNKASLQALKRISELDAKDAMWVASTGLDKLLKLKGEPDKVIEVRNIVVGQVVDKLVEAVSEGIIDKTQAEHLSNKFDEIDEAEYEEV